MENKQIKRINYKNVFKVLVILMLVFSCLLSISIYFKTSAETETIYSSVLEDLEKDENFDVSKYPIVEDDYSLQVIQIAESSDRELFVYVYQPSGESLNLEATSINISTGINDNLYYVNYDLSLLSSNGVFYKYLVNDFGVKEDALRYYDISSIYRVFDENIDVPSENDNITNEVSYSVGQLWTASTVNGEVSYTCVETETVEVVDKYVDFLRYLDGWAWFTYSSDSHYVAFSLDRPMDNIIEAEVSFYTWEYKTLHGTPIINVEDRNEENDVFHQIVLTNHDVVNNQTVGLFGDSHTWNRIQTISDFIDSEDLTEETKNNIKDKQWVLRFYESEYTQHGGYFGDLVGYGTGVVDVTILYLKFEYDGVVFNLGVVDNKTTSDITPGNEQKSVWERFLQIVISVISIILIIVAVIVLAPIIFPALFKFLGFCFKWLFKGIWWFITAPFSIFNDD